MKICTRCVLPGTYPGITFDREGVCNFCHEFEKRKEKALKNDFKDENELVNSLKKYKNPANKYDVLLSLSGGVDSCNALITIVERYGLRPLVFHNDHGYEDDTATRNAKKLCAKLGVDLFILQSILAVLLGVLRFFLRSFVGLEHG